MIEVVDYATIEPFSVRAPSRHFDRFAKFQTIAIERGIAGGPMIVGRWEFQPRKVGGRLVLHSVHTWVSGRCRRQGVAIKLWQVAIDVYKPIQIRASIISYAGCAFLGRMRAELAGRVSLLVDAGDWRDRLNDETAQAAIKALREIRTTPARRGKLEAVP